MVAWNWNKLWQFEWCILVLFQRKNWQHFLQGQRWGMREKKCWLTNVWPKWHENWSFMNWNGQHCKRTWSEGRTAGIPVLDFNVFTSLKECCHIQRFYKIIPQSYIQLPNLLPWTPNLLPACHLRCCELNKHINNI